MAHLYNRSGDRYQLGAEAVLMGHSKMCDQCGSQ